MKVCPHLVASPSLSQKERESWKRRWKAWATNPSLETSPKNENASFYEVMTTWYNGHLNRSENDSPSLEMVPRSQTKQIQLIRCHVTIRNVNQENSSTPHQKTCITQRWFDQRTMGKRAARDRLDKRLNRLDKPYSHDGTARSVGCDGLSESAGCFGQPASLGQSSQPGSTGQNEMSVSIKPEKMAWLNQMSDGPS